MTELEERPEVDEKDEETGYGAAIEGDMDEAPDQAQPHLREPASEEEEGQDNYANTDDKAP